MHKGKNNPMIMTRDLPKMESSPKKRRSHRSGGSRDSSPELDGHSSSCCSSSGETDPCVDSSARVDELSDSLSNNVNISPPGPPRSHSFSGSLPSEARCFEVLPPQPSPAYRTSANLLWLLVPVAIVFVAVFAFWLSIRSSAPSSYPSLSATIGESKQILREAFPEQPNATWAAFFAELRPQLEAAVAPARPAVVLLVGGEKDVTLPCLARRLGGLGATLLGGSTCRALTPEGEEGVSEDAGKLAMDQEARGAYARGERCFHLGRLEQLSKQQLLLLHAWCDGDHSPFRRALFLLVMRTETAMRSERDAERFLLQHWGEKVGHDEAGALNSRLANAVVIVRAEQNLVHERSCVNPS